MSAGHHGAHLKQDLAACLLLMRDQRFQAGLRRYRRVDEKHRIPFLAGSDNAGETVYYDESLPRRIRVDGKPIDPRKFIWWHETVEGVLIRLYHFDYARAHRYANAIEKMKVEKAGIRWAGYERALEPFIRKDEHELAGKNPPDLLLEPYRGTRWYRVLASEQRKAA